MDLSKLTLPLNHIFPPDLQPDPTGLVALGGSLTTMMLIEAYSRGIFPWAGSHPVPWYSPDPRLVLFPEEFHMSKSFRKLLHQQEYSILFDNHFETIINQCANQKRKHQTGTWIDSHIIEAYTELFQLDVAHCVEVYQHGELIGGLYGLSLGHTFFGESMFSQKPNGSKIALYHLCRQCLALGLTLIDCQQSTAHMISLGAREISRREFLKHLERSMTAGINQHNWASSETEATPSKENSYPPG